MFKNRGFTMVELLIVMAIIAGVFLFSAPLGLNFYKTQLIEEAQSNIIDALRRARHNAVLQKNDSNFGVILNDVDHNYVLYQSGNPDLDETFTVIDDITLTTGLSDIVFSKLTGTPSATGTIELVLGNLTRSILITDSGGIVATTTTP